MSQYNIWNVKSSYIQLIKLKSGIKNNSKVTLKLLSHVIGDDETNFPNKSKIYLFVINDFFINCYNTSVWTHCKVFANGSLANIKFSRTQQFKMVQLWGFTDSLFGFLL